MVVLGDAVGAKTGSNGSELNGVGSVVWIGICSINVL